MSLAFVKLLGGVRATAFAAVALVALAGLGLQSARLSSAKTELEARDAQIVALNAAAAEAKRRAESEVADVRAEYARSEADAKAELDRLVGELGRERRLRQRFRCPAPEAGTAGAPEGSDAAPQGGLLDADAEFLVRFAADADGVVRQLTACQNYVKAVTR